jgi:hypothetical protein
MSADALDRRFAVETLLDAVAIALLDHQRTNEHDSRECRICEILKNALSMEGKL